MLNSVLAWVAVMLAASAFAGFLFGASSALTLAARFLRPRAMTLRAPSRVRATPLGLAARHCPRLPQDEPRLSPL